MFSDPTKDFQDEYSQNILSQICKTSYNDLRVEHYLIIFQPYCSPGTVSETIPYIRPFFDYIKKFDSIETSGLLSIWEDFFVWTSHNIDELSKLKITDVIEHEVEGVFSYLGGYVWDVTKPYFLINNISGLIIDYMRHCHTCLRFKNVSDIMQNFNITDIKTKLVLMECWLYECEHGKIKGGVHETYSQDIQAIINNVTETILHLENIPREIDNLIAGCESYIEIQQATEYCKV